MNLSAVEAINRLNESVTVEMLVQRTKCCSGSSQVFLDSEPNHRDSKNLGVVPAARPIGKLDTRALAKAWDDLARSDAPRALRARWALASMPDATLALFQKQLKAAQPADPRRLQKLVDDLESPQFPVRSAANKELEELGDMAAGALRQALAKNSPLELRRRAQALLDKLRGPITRPEVLRAVRAVAVLEDIASPEARKLLEGIAQGMAETRLTREAQAALRRLEKR